MQQTIDKTSKQASKQNKQAPKQFQLVHMHANCMPKNTKIAKTLTLFSNNVDTTIRKYSSRAFI